jgi:hypothetical protein
VLGGESVLRERDWPLIGGADGPVTTAAVHGHTQDGHRTDLDATDLRGNLRGDSDVDGVGDGDVTHLNVNKAISLGLGGGIRRSGDPAMTMPDANTETMALRAVLFIVWCLSVKE